MADVPPRPQLQPGELAVLQLLARGLTERQAAEQLSYSYRHVRRLAAAAAARLGATNTRNAIWLATRSRIL